MTSCFWAFREKKSAEICCSLKPIRVPELPGRLVGPEMWPYWMVVAASVNRRVKALGASEVLVVVEVMVVLMVAVTLEVMVSWEGG